MRIDDMLVSMSDIVLKKFLKSLEDVTINTVIGTIAGLPAKVPRLELTEKVKQQAIQEGLYHFVKDDNVANLIIESQHLKPSKKSASYGKETVFMFCGKPSIDNYAKNVTDTTALKANNLWEHQCNPYINPTGVATAIKIMPTMDDLKNYTCRALTDAAMMYEGYCILPENAVQKVKMVPDLVRDENGNPLKNEKGEYEARFREALEDELSEDGKSYNAKQDYLDYIKEKGIEYGYLNKNGNPKAKIFTKTVATFDTVRMETAEAKNNFSSNWKEARSNFFKSLKNIFMPKQFLGMSAEDVLQEFNFKGKNPYIDSKFALKIAQFQSEQGLTQLNLKDVLTDFTKSKDGEFFNKKFQQIGNDITRKGIHGKEHSNRVALTAMIIARNEGLFENDQDNRVKEILSTAAMYHDIGRILDSGPHARNSARKISKMDLIHTDGTSFSEEDKKMVMALAEAHEGKPDKIEKMIKKYNIQDPKNVDMLRRLNSVVRDADALDRVRIDTEFPNYKVNLNPNYLVNNTSKRLVNAAYQLEFLTQNVPNMNNILNFGRDTIDASEIMKKQSEEFNERLAVKEPIVINLQPNKDEKDIDDLGKNRVDSLDGDKEFE